MRRKPWACAHTHAQARSWAHVAHACLPRSLSLSLTFTRILSPSSHHRTPRSIRTHTVTHTQDSHGDTVPLTHSHSETISHDRVHSHNHTLSHTYLHSHEPSLTCTPTCTPAHSTPPTVTHAGIYTFTHAHTHTHTLSHVLGLPGPAPCAPGLASSGCVSPSFEHPLGLASPGAYPEISDIGFPAIIPRFLSSPPPSGHPSLLRTKKWPETRVLPAPPSLEPGPTWGPKPPTHPASPPPPGGALERAPRATCASVSSSVKGMWSSHSTPVMEAMRLPRDREGHCQLENIVSNMGISHTFPIITPPHSVLGSRPREVTSELQHQGRAQTGSLIPRRSIHIRTTHCPRLAHKASVSKKGWVCGTRGTWGRREGSLSLFLLG